MKISLVSRNKNMRNFVSFRFALKKLKRNLALFRKSLVLFRENFVSFHIERDVESRFVSLRVYLRTRGQYTCTYPLYIRVCHIE